MFDGLKTKLILEKTDFQFNLNQFWIISTASVFNEVHSRVREKPKVFFSCFSHYIKLLCKIVILGKKKLN